MEAIRGRSGVDAGWGRLRVDVGSTRERSGVGPGSMCGPFKFDPGSTRVRSGVDVGSTWGRVGECSGSMWGPVWDRCGTGVGIELGTNWGRFGVDLESISTDSAVIPTTSGIAGLAIQRLRCHPDKSRTSEDGTEPADPGKDGRPPRREPPLPRRSRSGSGSGEFGSVRGNILHTM